MDIVNSMIAWESGTLSDEQTVDFFAHLIATGLVWQLQGAYGRTAAALVRDGYIVVSDAS